MPRTEKLLKQDLTSDKNGASIVGTLKRSFKMIDAAWQHQNLINVALDLGCTEVEIRETFTGDLKFRQFLETQLQTAIAERLKKPLGKV